MNQQETLALVEKAHIRSDIPRFDIGDTVAVHLRIIEGDKQRTQVFSGVLISRGGHGINETIVVRRIVEDHGVERILPLHSPKIAQIEVIRRGDARRAKLYYLRDSVGKSRRLRDRRRGMKHLEAGATPAANA